MELIKTILMIFLLITSGVLAIASSLMAYYMWHDLKETNKSNKKAR